MSQIFSRPIPWIDLQLDFISSARGTCGLLVNEDFTTPRKRRVSFTISKLIESVVSETPATVCILKRFSELLQGYLP